MKLERRQRLAPAVPIASMGDIAFLLIIFFILTSEFMQTKNIEHTLPREADLNRLQGKVSVIVDKDGEIWVQGASCRVEMLESAVNAILQDQQDKLVLLKIDKDLKNKEYRDVLRALGAAGADVACIGKEEN